MKRLIVFIFLIVLFCCINLPYINRLKLSEIFPNAQIEVYIDQKTETNGLNYINNGEGKIVFLNINQLDNFLKHNKAFGYTLRIKDETLNNVFKKFPPNLQQTISVSFRFQNVTTNST